jgi:hypothetical protein
MSDHHYPYTAPAADITQHTYASGRIYTPTQAAMGALLGGPVGVVYFLWANFNTLQKHTAASNTLKLGVMGIAAIGVSIILLPEDFPSLPFTILYVMTSGWVARKYQPSKETIAESEQFSLHSNWRVFGLGLLCLLGSTVVLFGMAAAAMWLGLLA